MPLARASADPTTRVCPMSGGLAHIQRAFARCSRSLYRFVAVRVGDDADLADDLMQQLWVRAATGARDVPEGEIEYWLRAVARNLVREHWRKCGAASRHIPVADPTVATGLAERITTEELPEELLEQREVRDQLILAVTELGTDEQELVVAHYFQGLSHATIAERDGISERAVEGRLYRARRTLRDKLRELQP